MIVKKINSDSSALKSTAISRLGNYIRTPQIYGTEKCVYFGNINFLFDDPEVALKEMIALAMESVRSKNPVNHYVISWPEGEQPSQEQARQAVEIFLKEMGLEKHQTIFGLHSDTSNLHLHIMVNRVHPDTLKCVEINKGFDIEAAHKAIARIEFEQGWQPEKRARYEVVDNVVMGLEHKETAKKLTPKARDHEHRTGEKSAERIAQEHASIILKAKSWQQLHRDLGVVGLRYETKGSGAVIWVGDQSVKASAVAKKASLSFMQERLGMYQPYLSEKEIENVRKREQQLHVGSTKTQAGNHMRRLSKCTLASNKRERGAKDFLPTDARSGGRSIDDLRRQSADPARLKRDPEPLVSSQKKEWGEYAEQRRMHYNAKQFAKSNLDSRFDKERKSLSKKHRDERNEAFSGSWKGRGHAMNALRSVVAARQAAERAELKERHSLQRIKWRNDYPPYPDYMQWLEQQGRPDLAEVWRYRQSQVGQSALIEGVEIHDTPESEKPAPRDIRSFSAEIFGHRVHYSSSEGDLGFIDNGKSIEIEGWKNADTTLAALQLASQKWGQIKINGDDDYKAMCVRLAAEHGFKIVNPELQDAIKAERERLRVARIEAMKSKEQKLFEQYDNAIGADRYRVTCIKMVGSENNKKAFVLGKNQGYKDGFTKEQVISRIPEMKRLQQRGENIIFTPLSENKRYVFIDDLSPMKLKKLLQDGFQPAIIMRTSPGNFQAIITVPTLDPKYNKEVGNRLIERLNREYGDPHLLGGIHPHRAPGFCNLKPKHRREDGTFPAVKLLRAERIECQKTFLLSQEILLECQKLRAEEAERKQKQAQARQEVRQGASGPVNIAADSDVSRAYMAHYEDVRKRTKDKNVDLSRVDSMIAVRLRITGHSRDDIEAVIRECAPQIRSGTQTHRWDDYARRTADYAFSYKGDQQVSQLGKYEKQWLWLEGKRGEMQQKQKGFGHQL